MRIDKLTTASFTFIALIVAACSSAPPTIPGDTGNGTDNKNATNGTLPGSANGTDNGTGTGNTGTNPKPGTGTAGGGACGSEASSDACWECCEDNNAAVAAKVTQIEKAWQTCACASSRCASACGNDYCAGAADDDPGTDACEECLDENTDECDEQEDAAWEALESDPAYASVDTCAEQSQCDSKPEEEEED